MGVEVDVDVDVEVSEKDGLLVTELTRCSGFV